MRYLLYIFLVVLAGCGKKPSEPRNSVANFQTTQIPLPPPPPDSTPTANDISGAKVDVVGAQSEVQSVLNSARSSNQPIAQAAVSPLTSADGRLTSAIQKLNDATANIEKLNAAIASEEKHCAELEKALKADIERLRAACTKDSEAANKQISEQAEKIKKMEDEGLQKEKSIFRWLGVVLMLIGAAGPIATLVWQVPFGWKIGALAFPLGTVSLAISHMLTSIVWWTEAAIITLIAGGIITAAIFGYHLLHHPTPTKAA